MHRAYRLALLFVVAALVSQARADEARALVTIGMQRVFEDIKPAYEAASGQLESLLSKVLKPASGDEAPKPLEGKRRGP